MKSWDKIKALIKNGEIDINNYVVLVPQELYERLLDEVDVDVEERVILYCTGIRIMWDARIKQPLLVSKDLFNLKYNSSDFVKLI